MWGDSSDLKSENRKGSISSGIHVRNHVTLNNDFLCLRGHTWIHSVRCRLPHIYILCFECLKTTSGKNKTKKKNHNDADTMCDNTFVPVTQKVDVTHCQIPTQ